MGAGNFNRENEAGFLRFFVTSLPSVTDFGWLGTKPHGNASPGGLRFPHENINSNQGGYMLRWAAIFFVIAIVAAILGFGQIAGAAANIAVSFFYLFVAIFVILLLLGLFAGRKL
jgi:uncharacterized membrane protein YtjA (UPF0391 family)